MFDWFFNTRIPIAKLELPSGTWTFHVNPTAIILIVMIIWWIWL